MRVLVIDPHPAVRAGLAVLLRAEPGLVPVGGADSAEAGTALARRARPAVVLLDHQLLGGDGLATCRRLKGLPQAPAVVLYTNAAADADLALHARLAGADGVVDKAAPLETLLEALRAVGRGATMLPALSPAQFEAAALRVDADDLPLLAMLADRTPAAEVAEALRLDGRRVGRRIERMLSKLRAPLHVRPA